MPPIPFQLRKAIEENKLIVFVGSGMSAKMNFPTWKELLLTILGYLRDDGVDVSFQSLHEYFSINPDNLSNKEIILRLLSVLEPHREPAKKYLSIILDDRNVNIEEQKITENKLSLHNKLWSLANNIVTTNYDQVLETANNRCEVILNSNLHLLNNFNPGSYNLFKIHGTIDDPNSCILFEDEYRSLYDKEQLSLFTLRILLKDYVLLFLGASMDDPYIAELFRAMSELCGNSARPNFIITKDERPEFKALNIQPILIKDYAEINGYIDGLLAIKPRSVNSSLLHYENELLGRDDELKLMTGFINDNDRHFFLLHGLGGIGKSHLVSKAIEKTGRKHIIIYGSISTSFNSIAIACGARIDHLGDKEERKWKFIDHIATRGIFLIIDDFYNVYDREFLDILPDLTRISAGKVLIISWAVPENIQSLPSYSRLQLGLLERTAFLQLIDNVAKRLYTGKINDAVKEAIYNKTQGHPLGAQFIVSILSLPGNIDQKLESLPRYDPVIDIEGTKFSKKILGVIYNSINTDEVKLLAQFSAFNEPVNKNLIAILPAYNDLAYIKLLNKDLIWQVEHDTIKLHTLIKQFMYEKLVEKDEINLILGEYYEQLAIKGDLDDIHSFETANYHFLQLGGEQLTRFESTLVQLFKSKKVKELISINTHNTIDRLLLAIKKIPDFLPYYNELGMAYRKLGMHDDAVLWLKQAAEMGTLYSMNELGMTYREMKDYPNAVLWLEQAAEKGNIPSMTELGITYRELKDYPNAVLWLEQAAKKGNIPSMTELGITYRELKDYPNAVLWFTQGAEKGDVYSMNELGITYREMKDYPNAVLWLKQAAEKENVHSMNELGMTYREMKDYPKAVLWLKQAAEKENVPSITEMGITYRELKDYLNAVLWLTRGAEKGNIYSMNELGITYREMKDYPNAVHWFKKATEKGTVYSMNELGITCREMKDYPNAVLWLKKAVDKGHISSFNELGITYREMKDYPNAVLWLKKAAEKGNIHSMNELGITYREMKDYPNAVHWLTRGAEKENSHSMNELGITYREMKDYPNAVHWLKQAAEQGNAHSINELGITYHEQGEIKLAIQTLERGLALNPDNVQILTKLSNFYQQDGQTDKAEEKLLHCLDVDNENEVAASLLSRIYETLGRYSKREEMLFKVYEKNKQNSFINLQLADVFTRYRKYRVSLKVLEQTRNKNLKILTMLMRHYSQFGVKDAYVKIRELGLKLFPDKSSYFLRTLTRRTLIGDIYRSGIFEINNGKKTVNSGKVVYEILDENHLNNKIKDGDKVYFAVYKINAKEVADYIEPYFENTDNLKVLK